jgi:hypothetical protein
MLKKLTLLAMSVAALIAFAIPATASAAEWTSNGEPTESHTLVKFTGHVQTTVFGAVGTTADTVHVELILKPGSTGTVTKFEVTNCLGIIGYAGNTCHVTTQKMPWVIHCNANGTISITNIHITHKYTGSNPPGDSTIVGGVTATADNNTAITRLHLASAGLTSNGLPTVISGSLNVDATHSGKIGCV